MAERIATAGVAVLLDSGVFTLIKQHCAETGQTFDEAIAMPPSEIAGYDKNLAKYRRLCRQHAEHLWGYVEVDIGGPDGKRATRRMLESEGLRPIPVYHPLTDGWDYFDEIAAGYDRICLANLSQTPANVRVRLLRTMWERLRGMEEPPWVHLLGFTPSETLNAYPFDSFDSSTWLNPLRWPTSLRPRAAGHPTADLPKNPQYRIGDPSDGPRGRYKACELLAYSMHWDEVTRQAWVRRMATIGGYQ